jgi:hypothetical protein
MRYILSHNAFHALVGAEPRQEHGLEKKIMYRFLRWFPEWAYSPRERL